MRDFRLVAIGLTIFVILFTFPFWINLGKTSVQTQPPALLQDAKTMQELADKLGVKDGAEFREKHRQVLSEWKQLVVRDGKRIFVTKDGREVPMSLENLASQPQSCTVCHDYAGIKKPSCWDCHEEPAAAKGVK